MNRRKFIKLASYGVPALSLAVSCSKSQNSNQKPNIVLVVVDDLGWMDLGCYGSTFYETPNIDRLASEGMRFTNAYSACPVCSPTRAALLTGKSPARLQFTGHITAIGRHRHPEKSRIIPPKDQMHIELEEVTIAEALKPAEYTSISIGKWHVGDEEKYYPTHQGFDENIAGYNHGSPPAYFYPYEDPEKEWNPNIPTLHGGQEDEYLTDRLTNEAIEFIDRSQANPFFLYLPYYAVHTPLQAPDELVKKYEKKLQTDGSQKNAIYAAMVERTDYNVGRLMKKLNDAGLRDNTLVILASDNGGLSKVTHNLPLREGKGFLYEGGIRVPLIIRKPGIIESGSVCHAPTISHDLYPTILGFISSSKPGDDIEGNSLMPLLVGKEPVRDRELYWYYPHYSPQAKQPASAVRDGRYKLIHLYDPERIELYDLENDLSEHNDLADKMPQKQKKLVAKLDNWIKSSGAVLHTMNPKHAEK
jgi:arylsulfatase A